MIELNIPEGKSGPFSIIVHPEGGYYTFYGGVKKFTNKKTTFLYEGDTSWMSSTPLEYLHMCRAAQWCRLNDKALIGGLGLGVLPKLIEKKSSEIHIIELNQDVINLVWPHIKTEKMELYHTDIEEYLDHTDQKYNYIFLDTWSNADYLNLVYITRLKEKAKRILFPRGKVICWCEYFMKKTLEQEYQQIAINFFKGLLPTNKKLFIHLADKPYFFLFYLWLNGQQFKNLPAEEMKKLIGKQITKEIKDFCSGYWQNEMFVDKIKAMQNLAQVSTKGVV